MNDDCVCKAEPLALARGACGARGVRRRGKGVRGAALAAGPARYLRPPARPCARSQPGCCPRAPLPGQQRAGRPLLFPRGLTRRRFRGAERGAAAAGRPRRRAPRTCAPRAGDMVGGGAACGAEAGRAERAACGAVEKCRRRRHHHCRRRGRGAQRGEGAGRAARSEGRGRPRARLHRH